MGLARWLDLKRRRWPVLFRLSHLFAIVVVLLTVPTGVVIVWPVTHAQMIPYLMIVRIVHSVLGGVILALFAGFSAAVFPYRRNLVDWVPLGVLMAILTITGVALLFPQNFPTWLTAPSLSIHLWTTWAAAGWGLVHILRKVGLRLFPETATRADRRVFLQTSLKWGAAALAAAVLGPVIYRTLSSGGGGAAPSGSWEIYSFTDTFPEISVAAYRLKVSGLVSHPGTLTYQELVALPQQHIVRDFRCVTGWIVSGVSWDGVSLQDFLQAVGPTAGARYVVFRSADGTYVDSLSLSEIARSGAFIGYRMEGQTVSRLHGGPVRLVVPQMFGYKSVKWLDSIELSATQPLGTWERYGYPTEAWFQG